MKKLSEEGIKLIKEFEGFRSSPYLDGASIPTIGYGSTIHPSGINVSMLDPSISEATAHAMLLFDLRKMTSSINKFLSGLDITLEDHQFDALICFAYNVGPGKITVPGKSMNLALRSGDENKIAEAFLVYNKITVNGEKVESKGLTKRRNKERDVFVNGYSV